MSALLRSGELKNYTALGQDGQPVYTVASQFRNAVKFKCGEKYADFLAVPQRNEIGNVIDWYVPFESTRADGTHQIIPWTSATEEERQTALAELESFKLKMEQLGKDFATSTSSDQQIFSRLLYLPNGEMKDQLTAIRFPNNEHIYLVDGKPVITFWGFIDKNRAPYSDPFIQLHSNFKPAEKPPTVAVPAALPPKKSGWLWWLLLLLLLLLLAGAAYWFYFKDHGKKNISGIKVPDKIGTVEAPLNKNDPANKITGQETKPTPDPAPAPTPAPEKDPVSGKETNKITGIAETKEVVEECKDPITYYKVSETVLMDKDGKFLTIKPRECDILLPFKENNYYVSRNGKWYIANSDTVVTDTEILKTLEGVNLLDGTVVGKDGVVVGEDGIAVGSEGVVEGGVDGTGTGTGTAEGLGLGEGEKGKDKGPEGEGEAKPEDNNPVAPIPDPTLTGQETNKAPGEENKNGPEGKPEAENNQVEPVKPLDPNLNTQNNNTVVPPVDPVGMNNNTNNTNNATGSTGAPNVAQNPNTKPLALTEQNIKSGDMKFLKGNWSSNSGLQDNATGRPLRLAYNFDDKGNGTVKLNRGDGVSCETGVTSSTVNGKLEINAKGNAKCTDGSSYELPKVTCDAGSSGNADCKGSYGEGKSFPIQIKTN